MSTDNAPAWDLSSSFQVDATLLGTGGSETPLSFTVDMAQNARGTITGSGVIIVSVGNDFVAAQYTVRGHISGPSDNPRVSLLIHLTGDDVIAGVETPFSITISYTLNISPISNTLDGIARGSANFKHLGTARIHEDVSFALPASANGTWTVQLNIVALSHVAGSATIFFPSGKVLLLHVSGSFSVADNVVILHLSGFGDSRGNSFQMVVGTDETGAAVLESVHGRVLGQIVDVVIAPPTTGGG